MPQEAPAAGSKTIRGIPLACCTASLRGDAACGVFYPQSSSSGTEFGKQEVSWHGERL